MLDTKIQEYFTELRKTIVPCPGYTWSTDYALALELLERGCLFGLVLYDTWNDGTPVEDVCRIKKGHPSGYSVGVRGIGYFDARDKEGFVEMCEKYKARFIVPVSEASHA